MIIREICIIGTGTFGSHLSIKFSEAKEIKKLILIDYDLVNENDILKGDFTTLGKRKVFDLSERIEKTRGYEFIKPIDSKNGFDFSKILRYSYENLLIIDCTDVLNNKNQSDIKSYISGRKVILDCRKNLNYSNGFEGRYFEDLSKYELEQAAILARNTILNKSFENILTKELVQILDIPRIDNYLQKTLKNESEKDDLIVQNDGNLERFYNFSSSVKPIIEKNKRQDIDFYLDSKFSTFPIKTTCLKERLQTPLDLCELLKTFSSFPTVKYNYIINIVDEGNDFYVELIRESGAA